MAIKVSELASELGFTNEQMVEFMLEIGIISTDITEELSPEIENMIREKLKNKKENKNHDNLSSLECVKINGLFYKYNYAINFEKDINILIAENGAGKTTILNILIATLKGDINKLKKLPFRSIDVKIKGEEFRIEKNGLENNINSDKVEFLLKRLSHILPMNLYTKIRNSIAHNKYFDLDELERYYKNLDFEYRYHYDYLYDQDQFNEARMIISRVEDIKRNGKFNNESRININKISKKLQESILYFPTYRRIEDQLDNIIQLTDNQVNEIGFKFKNSTLNFGISDVELTLNKLSQKLRDDANEYYTKMTAEILNDLLNNKISLNKVQEKTIDKEKIKIVVGRIGERKINDLDKLRSFIDKTLEVEYSEFLKYYIYKLINIYESQRAIDDKIKKFRDVCNKYLVNKEMFYNEVTADIQIIDRDTSKPIPFNYLSSGEKQILSLFSKLYLNTTRPSIFIIDEPELSLSIIWQKEILEDIYKSGSVALLIGTTHSPFIFKNSFNQFAKDLDFYKVEG